MSFVKQYDISAKEREILEWRKVKREQLRREYLMEIQEPNRKEWVPDKALLRFQNTRTLAEQLARPVPQRTFAYIITIGGLITFTCSLLKKHKAMKEQEYRTGQVSYKDRQFKFL